MDARIVGGAVPRAEDERFTTGAARYTEDVPIEGGDVLHAVFVRAYPAHARLLALDGAEIVVRGRFVNQRLAPAPMEGNAILVQPQADKRLIAWVSTQAAFWLREELAGALRMEEDRIRVITPAVGGAFGAKIYAC